jgi:hypothetical protein
VPASTPEPSGTVARQNGLLAEIPEQKGDVKLAEEGVRAETLRIWHRRTGTTSIALGGSGLPPSAPPQMILEGPQTKVCATTMR